MTPGQRIHLDVLVFISVRWNTTGKYGIWTALGDKTVLLCHKLVLLLVFSLPLPPPLPKLHFEILVRMFSWNYSWLKMGSKDFTIRMWLRGLVTGAMFSSKASEYLLCLAEKGQACPCCTFVKCESHESYVKYIVSIFIQYIIFFLSDNEFPSEVQVMSGAVYFSVYFICH